MTSTQAPWHVQCDPTNPGQFFACCGLLELADRLLGSAEGWFEGSCFAINARGTLAELVQQISQAPLKPLDPDDDTASPMQIGAPFLLRLDWWHDNATGGADLKVWAGSMRSFRIARAMQAALGKPQLQHPGLLNEGLVVYDVDQPDNKVEPFYFDARRGLNAHPLDLGFSPDALEMTTVAYPAVEFLALVGLQRARPVPTSQRRAFEYCTWQLPLAPLLVPAAVAGCLPHAGTRRYRFKTAFRTDQKRHKSFLPAIALGDRA
jgi:CRISPR-associated protein Csb3